MLFLLGSRIRDGLFLRLEHWFGGGDARDCYIYLRSEAFLTDLPHPLLVQVLVLDIGLHPLIREQLRGSGAGGTRIPLIEAMNLDAILREMREQELVIIACRARVILPCLGRVSLKGRSG